MPSGSGASAVEAWAAVHAHQLSLPPHTFVAYDRASLPHPREAGATVSLGMPHGQDADWRFAPDGDCRGLHVHEYAERWIVHLDEVHPACGLDEHLRADAPGVWMLVGAVGGGAVGGVLGRQFGQGVVGMLAGAALGMAAAGVSLG